MTTRTVNPRDPYPFPRLQNDDSFMGPPTGNQVSLHRDKQSEKLLAWATREPTSKSLGLCNCKIEGEAFVWDPNIKQGTDQQCIY